jgi:uncharacterized membrane protein
MSEEHDRDRMTRAMGWTSRSLGTARTTTPRVLTRIGGAGGRAAKGLGGVGGRAAKGLGGVGGRAAKGLSGVGGRAAIRGGGARDRAARLAVPLWGMRKLLRAAVQAPRRGSGRPIGMRVAGDLMSRGRSMAGRTGWSRRRIAAVTGAAATMAYAYKRFRSRRRSESMGERHPTPSGEGVGEHRGGTETHAAITVRRPRGEVYRFWRDFENFPRFMAHVESVEATDGRTHWKVRGPAKTAVEWDAEITADRPDELIAWCSIGGTSVPNSGFVRFADAPGGRGTEVRVSLTYDVPGGKAGLVVARLLGEHPRQQVHDDLRRFKQVMETGEVVRSEGSPEGTRAFRQARQRPAQPVG